jgi:predicted RND superfamily exporter protein
MLQFDSGTPENRTQRYARWVVRHRWWVLAITLFATLLAGSGIRKLGLATDYRTFFSEDNPDLAAYEAVENIYTKNDNVLFVIRPAEGEVFTPRVLALVRDLTEDAWQIPNSTRVDGITNFQHTWADGDELIVEDLVGEGEITTAAVNRARTVATTEPLLAGRLVSKDALTTGINVRIALPGESKTELPATVEHVRMLLDKYRAEAPMRDMPFVMPLMFGAFVLAIILFLRSVSGVVGTLTVLGFSTVTALGIAGHAGVLLDPVSSSAPTIILTLAVADSVHILVTWIRVNARPVFLTSITTAIGFLSLNFSDSPPFRLLGNISALGVMVAWAYSMTVLPALVAILPAKKRVRAGQGRLDVLLERFSNLIVRRYRPILAVMGAAAVLLSLSITRLHVNDQYIDYFDQSLSVHRLLRPVAAYPRCLGLHRRPLEWGLYDHLLTRGGRITGGPGSGVPRCGRPLRGLLGVASGGGAREQLHPDDEAAQ